MKHGVWLACLCAAALSGCGVPDWWLGAERGVLLQGFDAVTRPGEPATLRVSLRGGSTLSGLSDYTVLLYRGDERIGAAKTDADGHADFTVTLSEPGLHRFMVTLDEAELGTPAVPTATLQAGVYTSQTPFIVVDLDRTLVAEGFDMVLLADPEPMPHAQAVMTALAAQYRVLYLTHRPEYLALRSRQWLVEHDMPAGPLLVSRTEEFLAGSEAYKTAAIEQLKQRFPEIRAGVGDKITDVLSYRANGLTGILIIQPGRLTTAGRAELAKSLEALPDEAHVVTDWRQVQQVIEGRASYPPAAAREQLLAAATTAAGEGQP